MAPPDDRRANLRQSPPAARSFSANRRRGGRSEAEGARAVSERGSETERGPSPPLSTTGAALSRAAVAFRDTVGSVVRSCARSIGRLLARSLARSLARPRGCSSKHTSRSRCGNSSLLLSPSPGVGVTQRRSIDKDLDTVVLLRMYPAFLFISQTGAVTLCDPGDRSRAPTGARVRPKDAHPFVSFARSLAE